MKTDVNIAFGKNIAKLCVERNLTQDDLAFRCGFDRTYIGTIERREKSATINTVNKLAKGLGLQIKDLFDY